MVTQDSRGLPTLDWPYVRRSSSDTVGVVDSPNQVEVSFDPRVSVPRVPCPGSPGDEVVRHVDDSRPFPHCVTLMFVLKFSGLNQSTHFCRFGYMKLVLVTSESHQKWRYSLAVVTNVLWCLKNRGGSGWLSRDPHSSHRIKIRRNFSLSDQDYLVEEVRRPKTIFWGRITYLKLTFEFKVN